MKFRPCIDIHNGRVKQIVGSSLEDGGDNSVDNYVSVKSAGYYASLYRDRSLSGGHVILLNPKTSQYYAETRRQAFEAFGAFPGGLQAGGGINPEGAADFLDAGASHVIVTSYIFHDGILDMERLGRMVKAVTPEKLVLDMSCRKISGKYIVTTDRWQKNTEEEVNIELLKRLSDYCGEFLIHAVDVEGMRAGIDTELIGILSEYTRLGDSRPVCYAGGIRDMEDVKTVEKLGHGKVDITVGSALSLFGGDLDFDELADYCVSCT